MASMKRNGQTIYSGGGRHSDKRTRRQRTRQASKRAAIQENMSDPSAKVKP